MERKNEFKINVGASSIILIIIVFALSIFAVLSIKVSNSDLILAKKTRDSVEEYYTVDAKAEHILMELDQELSNYYNDLSNESLKSKLQQVVDGIGEVDAKSDKVGTVQYEVSINQYATLQVSLDYDLDSQTGSLYNITKWEVVQQGITNPVQEETDLLDGTDEKELVI